MPVFLMSGCLKPLAVVDPINCDTYNPIYPVNAEVAAKVVSLDPQLVRDVSANNALAATCN